MNKHLKIFSLFTIACSMSLVGCSCSGEQVPTDFDFTVSLSSGKKAMLKNDSDKVVIFDNGNVSGQEEYVYASSDEGVISVDASGNVSAVGEGRCSITVTEVKSNIVYELSNLEVFDPDGNASGGYNYASSTGASAVNQRTEILGKLEKYAMDSHLTGISLFENGGYVKYSKRITLPTTNYITGYGFGILSEGKIEGNLSGETIKELQPYLHSSSASNPPTINAYNNDGSEVSDLHGYISSSYWGTKLNDRKDGYVWYPVLAKSDAPIPNEKENATGLYKKWKFEVKTGADGLQYRTLSSERAAYEKRNVELADYEFIYRALLTGSSKMSRGAQMAADQSYGIKGALQYYNATKTASDAGAYTIWKNMQDAGKLGFKTSVVDGKNFIEIEFINPLDEFTAMYSLSSNLTSPLPEDFIKEIGDGSVANGMKKYGSWNSGNDMLKYCLNVGPFMLEKWNKGVDIRFKRNDDWFEVGDRYHIQGVYMRIVEAAQKDPDALYNLFNNQELDSCGIPIRHIEEEVGQPGVLPTKGDSTFKLNVNSCTEERWDELFGENGKIYKNAVWDVKPWMSNDDFLDGLFYSINRKEFANKRGVTPSINYFADAYMSDPKNGKSYNETEAHKSAVAAYQVVNGEGEDMYGFDKSRAINCFKSAVNTLVKNGQINYGQTININIEWMYESDKTEYGEDIIHYFEDAFNDPGVCGNRVTLQVTQSANADWQEVYTHMRKGQFDLAFGAISGNTLAPLNFLEVLKSDNSSGFTLNWGADTGAVDNENYLIYQDHLWSFDALWAAADHGCVVEDGKAAKSVKKAYIDSMTKLDGTTKTGDLGNGGIINVNVEFVSVTNVTLTLDSVNFSVANYGNYDVPVEISGNKAKLTISKELADAINAQIKESNNKTSDPEGTNYLKTPNYDKLWSLDMYYNLQIGSGAASQNYEAVAVNADRANNQN